jgi:hypothetical protein
MIKRSNQINNERIAKLVAEHLINSAPLFEDALAEDIKDGTIPVAVYDQATTVGSVPNARLIGKTKNSEMMVHSRANVVGGIQDRPPDKKGGE